MRLRTIIAISHFLFILTASSQIEKEKLVTELGTSLDTYDFEWSIAGNIYGQSPNVLSELKFYNIVSKGYYSSLKFSPVDKVSIFLYYQQSKVIDGMGLDSDYKEDNRKGVSFKKEFFSNKGELENIRIGYTIPIFTYKNLKTASIISYSFRSQNFQILGGRKEKDLNSSYLKRMKGVQFLINNNYSFNKVISFSIDFAFSYVNYKAKANWNLIKIFKHPLSFSHYSRGTIFESNFTFKGRVNKYISILIGGELRRVEIGRGVDTAHLVTGKNINTQFNGGKGYGYGLKTGVYFFFK